MVPYVETYGAQKLFNQCQNGGTLFVIKSGRPDFRSIISIFSTLFKIYMYAYMRKSGLFLLQKWYPRFTNFLIDCSCGRTVACSFSPVNQFCHLSQSHVTVDHMGLDQLAGLRPFMVHFSSY